MPYYRFPGFCFYRHGLLLFVAAVLLCSMLPAQVTTKGGVTESTDSIRSKGKSYALVTGISKYQDITTYRSLRYADADAREFYSYLVSPQGGQLNRDNVDTLMNAQAGFMEFWKKFNRIKDKLKKGDVFYIYFSGHGDAYRADEAYLLAYDAPAGNDRNNYSAGIGLIDIHKLKIRIEELTRQGIQVILITDACRTNELPGKEEGRTIAYQQIFERKAGEIQFISCSSNQVSFEGPQWGGGRGLFSWYFINGLKGMADTDPEDGEVTLAELYDYVKKNVNRASYDKGLKEYKQTPRYCCSDVDGLVLSAVNKEEKQKLAAQLSKGSLDGMSKEDALLAINKGGGLEEEMKKAGLEEWYKKYVAALNTDLLIGKGGAYELLQQVLDNKNLSFQVINELKFELSSLLMGDVSKVINTYLTAGQNNNLYTYKYFNSASQKLSAFRTIADTAYYNPLDVEVNRLFLDGHANWRSDRRIDQQYSLRKVDSAIALKPQAAYLYNLKGLMHSILNQPLEAEKAYRKGIMLAPNWLYPNFNLGVSFTDRGMKDSAMKYYRKAIQLDSNYQTTYAGLSNLYAATGQPDSAIYYLRVGLKKDPNDPYLWTSLGHQYLYAENYTEAMKYYHRAMQADSTVIYPNEGAMQVFVQLGDSDSTNYYVTKMTSMDPGNPVIYESIGYLALKYNLDSTALNMFELAIQFDSVRVSAWQGYGEAASRLGRDTSALGAYYLAMQIDSLNAGARNAVGNQFYKMELFDNARVFYKEASALDPQVAVYHHNIGEASFRLKEYDTAKIYFDKAILLDPAFGDTWYRLACIAGVKKDKKAMLHALDKAFGYEDYRTDYVATEECFKDFAEDADFKALLKKEDETKKK